MTKIVSHCLATLNTSCFARP